MNDLRRDLHKLVRELLAEHDPTDREPVARLIRAHLGDDPGASPIYTEEMEGWSSRSFQLAIDAIGAQPGRTSGRSASAAGPGTSATSAWDRCRWQTISRWAQRSM